jgi:ABC-type dipeptide/oligopeptide/nickel transport system ATPase component
MVMKDGKIVESGTVFEVFYKPKSAYTRALLAARLRIPADPAGKRIASGQ